MRSNEPTTETKPMLNLSPEVLDHLLKDYKGPQDLIGDNGILQQLTKALVERLPSQARSHTHLYNTNNPNKSPTANLKPIANPDTGSTKSMRSNAILRKSLQKVEPWSQLLQHLH